MNQIEINQEKCKGYQLCIQACPLQLIRLATNELNSRGYNPAQPHDPEHKCTACGMCYLVCPDVCITVHKGV